MMPKIKYSRAFMDKFGETVLNRKNEIFTDQFRTAGFNLFDYLINWKTRKRVSLTPWLKSQIDSPFANGLIAENKWKDMSADDTALAILRFVKRVYTYEGDSETWGTPEAWATFEESYAKKKGDCEDGAIAIFVLCRKSGIPERNIKLVAGDVQGGGHCYVVYTAEDGVEYVLDWCYWPDVQGFETRPMYWDLPNYFYGEKMWFAVTDVRGYVKNER